jgi:hypothetical protein
MSKFAQRLLCLSAIAGLGAAVCTAALPVGNFSNGPVTIANPLPILTPGDSGVSFTVTLPPAGSANITPGVFDTPSILSVRGRIVKVQVPTGYKRVSLERKTIRRAQPWAAVATQNCDGAIGEVTFRLRAPLPKRVLRVTGSKDAIPSTTDGTPTNAGRLSTFYADPSGNNGGQGGAIDSGGLTLADGAAVSTNSFSNAGLSLSSGSSVSAAPVRDVVESDIWKLQGDRLYIYNAYRGLQVVDVSDPANPGLLGNLYLPQAGDALYVLDDTHVALITHTPLSFMWNQKPGQGQQSGVMICDVSTGSPRALATLIVPGIVAETRLVGSALYVASQVYPDNGVYGSPEIQVTGFDLSQPAHPVQRNTVAVTLKAQNSYSYLGAVQASDHYFLVASNVWSYDPATFYYDYYTHLGVVDITAPDGRVKLRGDISVDGMVQDKFKLHEKNGVVSVISDHWGWWSGASARHVHLENFSLANPDQPKSVGELDLGTNESLQGARFDGDRIYIVTWWQIDPLWIIDNANPKKPAIVGHVQVPGFSTYLEPLGDRLVTLGFMDERLTISLFDVADATNPRVVQQLPVSENWAYSEASWNDKAFTVLPDEGLIMLPLTESWYWNWDDVQNTRPENGIQLVDFTRDSLTKRGRIAQPFAPRRSLIHRDAVLALGDTSLLTANIKNRDHPMCR